jgi:hypothetical protein
MRRVFAVDVLARVGRGSRLRLIATLDASDAAQRLLRHLVHPTEMPPPTPGRAPACSDGLVGQGRGSLRCSVNRLA